MFSLFFSLLHRECPPPLLVDTRSAEYAKIAVFDDTGREREKYPLVYGAKIKVKDGGKIEVGQKFVEWDPYSLTILTEVGGKVAMGDITEGITIKDEEGLHTITALTRADIGIAIGSGTDVAIESAYIILVQSNPLDVVNIFELSRATYRKMIENLVWATAYNLVALPLAAGILVPFGGFTLSPAVGAAFMSLSTVVVAINAHNKDIGST